MRQTVSQGQKQKQITAVTFPVDIESIYIYIELANEVLENLYSSEGKLVTLVTASCSRTFHVTGELRGVIHGHGLQYLTVEVVDYFT